jgi:hypothetical protein
LHHSYTRSLATFLLLKEWCVKILACLISSIYEYIEDHARYLDIAAGLNTKCIAQLRYSRRNPIDMRFCFEILTIK